MDHVSWQYWNFKSTSLKLRPRSSRRIALPSAGRSSNRKLPSHIGSIAIEVLREGAMARVDSNFCGNLM